MNTKTINLRELPEDLVRRAKAFAALRGLTLKDFVVHALTKAMEGDLDLNPETALLLGSYRPKKRARKAKAH